MSRKTLGGSAVPVYVVGGSGVLTSEEKAWLDDALVSNPTVGKWLLVDGSLPMEGDLSLAGYILLNYRENIVTTSTGTNYQIDGNLANIFEITVTGDVVVSFTNMVGRVVTVNIIQDGVGGHTVSFSGVLWADGTAPTLVETASNRSKLVFDGGSTTIDGALIGEGWA